MFDLFSVNPMIRELNRVVKKKNAKKGAFRAFFAFTSLTNPINRGFHAVGISCLA
jgi:hypothetical protein